VYISSDGEPVLVIFADFYREEGLPKYKTNGNKIDVITNGNIIVNGTINGPDSRSDDVEMSTATSTAQTSRYALIGGKIVPRMTSASSSWERDTYIRHVAICEEEAKKILDQQNKKKGLLARIFGKKNDEEVDALITFDKVKQQMLRDLPSTEELTKACEATVKYINWLKASGQHGMADHLIDVSGVVAGELVLMQNGYGKYITQQEVIDFFLKSERGVRIDFLRYYPEVLPIEVAKKKQEADKLNIFDNYAVMYYSDKVSKFIRKEQEEIEDRKRRDPILFGMIEGSNRLYYITDWVLKDDDLTLEKLEHVLGRKAQDIMTSNIANTELNTELISRTMVELEQLAIDNEHNANARPIPAV
jgi:hypothetical protein